MPKFCQLLTFNKFSQFCTLESFDRKKIYIILRFPIKNEVSENFPDYRHHFKAVTTKATCYYGTLEVWKTVNDEVRIWCRSEETPLVMNDLSFASRNYGLCFLFQSFHLIFCHFCYFINVYDFWVLTITIATHSTEFESWWSNSWYDCMSIKLFVIVVQSKSRKG